MGLIGGGNLYRTRRSNRTRRSSSVVAACCVNKKTRYSHSIQNSCEPFAELLNSIPEKIRKPENWSRRHLHVMYSLYGKILPLISFLEPKR